MTESETSPGSEEDSDGEHTHYVPEKIDLPQSEKYTNYSATDFIVVTIPILFSSLFGYLIHIANNIMGYPIKLLPSYEAWCFIPILLSGLMLCGEVLTIVGNRTRLSYCIIRRMTFGSSRITRFLFKQSSALFVGLAIMIPLLAFERGLETAAVATLFYASVILLKEILLDSTAVLHIGDQNYYWRDDDGGFESTTKLIQNVGSERASSVSVTYRAYDKRGRPLMKPNKAKISPEYLSVDVGETIPPNQIFAPISTDIGSKSETALVIHYKAEDGFGKSLLPARAIESISAE